MLPFLSRLTKRRGEGGKSDTYWFKIFGESGPSRFYYLEPGGRYLDPGLFPYPSRDPGLFPSPLLPGRFYEDPLLLLGNSSTSTSLSSSW